MCLAVPLKIIEVNGKTAVAEAMGVSREIRVDFIPEPKLGTLKIGRASCRERV